MLRSKIKSTKKLAWRRWASRGLAVALFLITLFYALMSWRAYAERERTIEEV